MEIFDKKGRNTVKVVSRDAPGYTGDLKISEQYPKILLRKMERLEIDYF